MSDYEPSQDDTTHYHKVKSDNNIVLPTDLDWFLNWRKELTKSISALREDVAAIKEQMQDNRITLFKHDDQIQSLAKDMAATDNVAALSMLRILALEKSDGLRNDRELTASSGVINQVKTSVIITIAVAVVGGGISLVWFLIGLYAKAQAIGATP